MIYALFVVHNLRVLTLKVMRRAQQNERTHTQRQRKDMKTNKNLKNKKEEKKHKAKQKYIYSDDAEQMHEEKCISRFLLFIYYFFHPWLLRVPIYPWNNFRWHELHMNNNDESFGVATIL